MEEIIMELERLRETTGISQRQIARWLKVTPASYNRWIRDERSPNPHNIKKAENIVPILRDLSSYLSSQMKRAEIANNTKMELEKLREETRIHRSQLARWLGVTRRFYCHWQERKITSRQHKIKDAERLVQILRGLCDFQANCD